MTIELMAIAECMGYTDGGFKAVIRGTEVYGIFTIYPAIHGDGYTYPTDIIIGKGKKFPRLEKVIAKLVEEEYGKLKEVG